MNCNKFYTDKECNTYILDNNFNRDYAYVYILQLNQTLGVINQVFIKTSAEDQIKFDLKLDGFYTLTTLIVPLNSSMPYYEDGKFYKNMLEVELQELLEVNPEVSLLSISYEYYFQTCNLRKCYINICLKIFDLLASIKCASSNVDRELIYKRDLIWSALNVINYMVEFDLYEEAERLLERITDCNGLCKNNTDNCGCS